MSVVPKLYLLAPHLLSKDTVARQRPRNKQRDNDHLIGNSFVNTQQYWRSC
jgi:hypothetical protein